MISHHPSEATLVSYAAGTLPEALALVAATHLSVCPACRLAVSGLDTVGGLLLDEVDPVPLSGVALDRLLERAGDPAPALPVLQHTDLPPPLNRVAMGRWWPIGAGLWYRPMKASGRAWGGLIWGQHGRALPRHGHDGQELTCVISGAFEDSAGRYAPGDLSEPEYDHDDRPPIVVSAEACLCVIASEGMRLRGLLGLAQRLTGT